MKIVYENVSDRLQTNLSRLKGVKKVGPNTYRAYSPLRDEKEPSLYITEKPDGTILMCDHGGGDTKAILEAIGLTMRILFPDGGSSGSETKGSDPERKVAAIYQYLDTDEELDAEKVRYTNKTIIWRQTAATTTIYRRMFPCIMEQYWKRRKQSFWLRAKRMLTRSRNMVSRRSACRMAPIGKMSMPHTFPTR